MSMQWILFLTFIGIFAATAIITLLGVTEKIHVKPAYLKALFGALLIELIGAVITQFGETDFFAAENAIIIAVLPEEYQAATPNKSIEKMKEGIRNAKVLNSAVADCSNKLDAASDELKNCTTTSSGALAIMLQIQEDLKVHGPTINFMWRPEIKKDAALHVMDALGALGFSSESPVRDPAKAAVLLTAYQKSKGIEPASGKLGRKTFIQFLNDYIIVETNGG